MITGKGLPNLRVTETWTEEEEEEVLLTAYNK